MQLIWLVNGILASTRKLVGQHKEDLIHFLVSGSDVQMTFLKMTWGYLPENGVQGV